MKTTSLLKMSVLLLAALSVVACTGNKSGEGNQVADTVNVAKDCTQFVLKHLGVEKKKVMAYVICSEQMVDSLLAIADTVYSKADNYNLMYLDLENIDYNKWIAKDYKDTIPIVIALFDSYASMVNSGMDEANASFVWHEVARLQMKHFYEKAGGEWKEPIGYEKLFHVTDGIIGIYGCGSQADMNVAAWRSVMPTDYRLIEAYKQLADLCNDKSMAQFIHDDYMYTLTTYREHRESIDERYSDLPREQGVLFECLLSGKLDNVNHLIKSYKKGKIGNDAVKKNLQEHLLFANKDTVKLTKDFLDRARNDF